MRLQFPLPLTIILIIPIFFSCNKTNKNSKISNTFSKRISLTPINSVEFKLDSVTPSYSRNIQYFYSDSIELLLYQNESQNEIILFNFHTKQQIKKLSFNEVGPEAIGKIAGFFLINLDSIVVVGNKINQLSYFDLNGNLIHKLEFKIDSNQRDLFPVINPILPYLVSKDTIIVPVRPEGLWGNIKDFSQESVAALVNQKVGRYTISKVTYPHNYYKNGFSQPTFSRIKVNNFYLYSFYNYHNLFKTLHHKSFEEISAKSSFIDKLYGMKTPSPSMEEYLTWLSESPAYLGLIYDPYRKLIYRFIKLKYEVKKTDNLHETNRFPVNIGVMIYDENLNLLGEQKLPSGKYFWKNSFVGKNGLYMNTCSPFNSSFTSEKLSFELFTIDKNDKE